MSRILVPYHLDEHHPDLGVPFEQEVTVSAELRGHDTWTRLAGLYDDVADAVARDVGAGSPTVVMSGDCTTSLGVVTGLQRAGLDPAVVWFDAHGDVQTLETTTSGYVGGMPLRILTGYRPELISRALGLRPVDEADVVLVDARDLDPPERAYLESSAVRRVEVGELAGDAVPGGRRPVYLHVDLDVVDPRDLPGLLFPASGGPPLTAVAEAVAQVMATGRVAAVGLASTWHAGRGAPDTVRAAFADVLAAA